MRSDNVSEVGSQETNDFHRLCVPFEEFVPVGDAEYGEVTCGTVEEGSMTLLCGLTESALNLRDGREPPLVFVDIGSVIIEAIIKGDSKALHRLNWLIVNADVAVRGTGFIAGFSGEEFLTLGDFSVQH